MCRNVTVNTFNSFFSSVVCIVVYFFLRIFCILIPVFDDFLVGEYFGFVSCACISGGPFEFSGNSMSCYGSPQVICYLFIYIYLYIYLFIYLRFILELLQVADAMYHGMIQK